MADQQDSQQHINKRLEVTLRDGLDRLEDFTLGLAYGVGGKLFEKVSLESQTISDSRADGKVNNKVIRLDPTHRRHNNSGEKTREKIA